MIKSPKALFSLNIHPFLGRKSRNNERFTQICTRFGKKGRFEKLNAVSSGVGDAKKVIELARQEKAMFGTQTYLLLDECHRWSKAQSDCVLEAIEDGSIIFIGSTTENPYTSMTRAIVSRCRVFEFKALSTNDVLKALNKAIKDKEKIT